MVSWRGKLIYREVVMELHDSMPVGLESFCIESIFWKRLGFGYVKVTLPPLSFCYFSATLCPILSSCAEIENVVQLIRIWETYTRIKIYKKSLESSIHVKVPVVCFFFFFLPFFLSWMVHWTSCLTEILYNWKHNHVMHENDFWSF